MNNHHPSKFIAFKQSVDGIALPERFTFPFYYEPHPLAILASKELQNYIESQTDWKHNFGVDPAVTGMVIGKMFGVLVVQNKDGELGYLAAFSGKLADSNDYEHFVPPVFDMLTENGFYRKCERDLINQSAIIEQLENSEELKQLKNAITELENTCKIELQELKETNKISKKNRKIQRENANLLDESKKIALLKALDRESIIENFALKDLKHEQQNKLRIAQEQLVAFENHIKDLKTKRKQQSQDLQNQLFDQYHFLNALGETRSVLSIFQHIENGKPPSGAGECCAPKLLHYAYQHQLKPIALAEFWWGASPASEIRKHKHYYPSCRGKCEPILGHMLVGLDVDPNPMKINPAEGRELPIVYEDEDIVVVNKPTEFLSVPGKTITDSVLKRMESYLVGASGPLLIHRLDMSTSGLLLVAKNKYAHDFLQRQFIKRSVQKRYVALLNGVLERTSGIIDLPLRVDLDDRPRQLVCYEYGKPAQTKWELIEVKNGQSKVYFYPLTGRTHQLRVHAAHPQGLNMSIVGDDLYGIKTDRLYLHAEQLTFRHPRTKEWMTVEVKADF
ncbi:MAG: pseudouridine synthase [Crocinitomicaceae bacterium]|nr:pseudouridine synthase [Crocinitomicaceae bacterium]